MHDEKGNPPKMEWRGDLRMTFRIIYQKRPAECDFMELMDFQRVILVNLGWRFARSGAWLSLISTANSRRVGVGVGVSNGYQ